jgi:transposase
MKFYYFIGCDISKANFHFCVYKDNQILIEGEVKNTQKAIKLWIKMLKATYPCDEFLIGIEHTGIYGAILLREAHKAGVTICVENARQIKRSLGLQRGKTDKVDASRISEYLSRFSDKLRFWAPNRAVVGTLTLLLSTRRRLGRAKRMLASGINEDKHFLSKDDYLMCEAINKEPIEGLTKKIKVVEKKIQELISGDDKLKSLYKLVSSVKGVGLIGSAELIARTNEFTKYENAKEFACTAGIAPFEHSSGSSIRGRTRVSPHGHKTIKTILHLCAMSAIKGEGDLSRYYARKVKEGKNKMTVLNAVRNKIIHRVFAVVKNEVMYDKNYQYSLG